jgi:predicted peptidase
MNRGLQINFNLRWLLISGLLTTMITAQPASAEATMAVDSDVQTPVEPGTHDLSIDTESGTLRYTVHVPQRLTQDGNQALILVLHYGGQASGFYGRPLIEQLVLPAFGELNAIIVAPVTMGGDWSNPGNEKAIFALLSTLEVAYSTNPRQRLITGYSMGGMGTWHLIARHTDYFSAAISISGFTAIDPKLCETPIYALHSRADSIFDADKLQSEIDKLVAAGCDAQVDYIEGIDHFDIPAFAPMLKATLPWVQNLWAREPKAQ